VITCVDRFADQRGVLREPLMAALGGKTRRLITQQHHNLALHVEAGVVVVSKFRRGDAVTGEDERPFGLPRRREAERDEVLIQLQRFLPPAKVFLHIVMRGKLRARGHCERLKIALCSGGLEAQAPVTPFQHLRGAFDAFRARAAAFHLRRRKRLDGLVVTRGIGFANRKRRSGRRRLRQRSARNNETQQCRQRAAKQGPAVKAELIIET
jgi:hypothetical protein